MKPARKILPHNFWSIYPNNMNLIQIITQTIIGRWKPSKPRVMLDSPKIEISNLFAQKAPLIVEIGVGKGLFIRKYAQQTPEMNFLGIEKFLKWTRHAAKRIENAKLPNVKLVAAPAEEILPQLLDESVHEFHILFPDPWPKRRHNQRRVIQNGTIQLMHEKLEPRGLLHIATDHKEYYDWICKILKPWIDHHFDQQINMQNKVLSNYQIKYMKEGRPIYELHLLKR